MFKPEGLTPDQQKQVKKTKIILWLGMIAIVIVGLAVAVYFIFINPLEGEGASVNSESNKNIIIADSESNINNANANVNNSLPEELQSYIGKECSEQSDCGVFPCINGGCLVKACTCSCQCSGNICGSANSDAPGYCMVQES